MPIALVATSHSPLIGQNDPAPEVRAEVDEVLGAWRATSSQTSTPSSSSSMRPTTTTASSTT